MKTRSQTKKEKLIQENPQIPQLNEDILGIILKHVVEKQQNHVMETCEFIDEYACASPITYKPNNWRGVKWPVYLDSNSRRLVYHTQVKLLPNHHILVHESGSLSIYKHIKSKRDLDILWMTLKHFSNVRINGTNGESVAEFFQGLWGICQQESWLIQELEQRLD